MQLRDYQEQAIGDLRACYGNGSRAVLFVLPTGGGKTVVFSHVAKNAAAKGNRVCVLVHRAELLEQACRALEAMGIEHGRIHGKYMDTEPMVVVASVQTLVRRLERVDPSTFALLVVDEAHHTVAGSWAAVTRHFAKARILGVTATPCRLDGKGLHTHYDDMVIGPTPYELTERGFLARARVFCPPIASFKRELLKARGGDYRMEEAEEQLTTRAAMGDVVTHYLKHLQGGTAIAFCCTVSHAEAVANAFIARGIPAESIDGSMNDDERKGRLERLASGETRVLTSCMLIGEGVDVPSVNGCILYRPTASTGLFLQMVGRCLRPDGDKVAVILDHVGNYDKHGHHLEDREWTLKDGIKKRDSGTPLSVWTCPECFCCNESKSRECLSCGYVKPQPEVASIIEVEGSLVEIAFDPAKKRREQAECQTFEDLVALGTRRGYRYPRAWATKVFASRRNRRHTWKTPVKHESIDRQAQCLATFFGGEVIRNVSI